MRPVFDRAYGDMDLSWLPSAIEASGKLTEVAVVKGSEAASAAAARKAKAKKAKSPKAVFVPAAPPPPPAPGLPSWALGAGLLIAAAGVAALVFRPAPSPR